MKVPSYNKENRKTFKTYVPLPKGNYVCKIMSIEETTYSSGKTGLKIYFDIAEGDYKDFYTKQYQESDKEDKKWNFDATYYLTIPTDGCESYILDGKQLLLRMSVTARSIGLQRISSLTLPLRLPAMMTL